jgi:hypothetical protein
MQVRFLLFICENGNSEMATCLKASNRLLPVFFYLPDAISLFDGLPTRLLFAGIKKQVP